KWGHVRWKERERERDRERDREREHRNLVPRIEAIRVVVDHVAEPALELGEDAGHRVPQQEEDHRMKPLLNFICFVWRGREGGRERRKYFQNRIRQIVHQEVEVGVMEMDVGKRFSQFALRRMGLSLGNNLEDW